MRAENTSMEGNKAGDGGAASNASRGRSVASASASEAAPSAATEAEVAAAGSLQREPDEEDSHVGPFDTDLHVDLFEERGSVAFEEYEEHVQKRVNDDDGKTTASAEAMDIELIGADDEPPPATVDPTVESEKKQRAEGMKPAGIEHIVEDDNDAAIVGFANLHAGAAADEGSKRKARGRVERIEEDSGPGGPVSSMLESDIAMNEKMEAHCSDAQSAVPLGPPAPPLPPGVVDDNSSINKSRRFDGSVDDTFTSITSQPREGELKVEEGGSSAANTNRGCGEDRRRGFELHDVASQPGDNANTSEDATAGADENGAPVGAAVSVQEDYGDRGEHRSTLVIPEAFAVEDEDVIMATPLEPALPWYNQRRSKCFLGVGMVLLAGLAVSLGMALTRSNNQPASSTVVTVIAGSSAPSLSNAPSSFPSPYPTRFPSIKPTSHPSSSTRPTTAPSFKPSPFPSSSPSACVNKIISDKQLINLPLDDPQRLRLAIDGRHMVVVARQGIPNEGGPLFIVFYTMENGLWRLALSHIKNDLGTALHVSISDKTTFVGASGAGTVLVFEQNESGGWEEVDDPLVRDASYSDHGFGRHVEIDGDLACVSDSNDFSHLFRREGGKWIQFDRVKNGFAEGNRCLISGDIIAIRDYPRGIKLYRYDRSLKGTVLIQDSIPAGSFDSMDLSNDYLVYYRSEGIYDAFVYRRDPSSQTFYFLQQLNIDGPGGNRGLALDKDILVIREPLTHIFSEVNGRWTEAMILDQRYRRYAVSGRTLIAMKNNIVHSYSIQDCAQAMPTQTPSLSNAPSTSLSPTATCYWIDIAIIYDQKPSESSWSLFQANDAGDGISDGDDWLEIKRHQNLDGDASHVESICLREGRYRFYIYDEKWPYDGICCGHGNGNYNVMTSDEVLIVEGGSFRRWEKTYFSIPFIPGTSTTESGSF